MQHKVPSKEFRAKLKNYKGEGPDEVKSLKTKLHIFILLLVMCTNVLATGITCWLYYRNSVTQAEETSTYLADSYKELFGGEMEKYRKLVALAGQLPNDASLQQQAKEAGFFYFAFADAQGNTEQDGNVAETQWFQSAKAGTAFVGSPAESSRGNGLTLMVAAPAPNGQIVYGEVNYDVFSQVLGQVQVGKDGYAFVVDQNARTVLHPTKETVANPIDYFAPDKINTPIAKLYERILNKESGVHYTVYQGNPRLVGFTILPGPEQWGLAITRPINQIMDTLNRTLIINVAVGIVLQLLALAATIIFASRLTKPIVQATRRIELLAEGDLHTEIPQIQGKDEIARLTTALDNTLQELRSYIGDISQVLEGVSENDLTVESGVKYRGDFVPIQNALDTILLSLNQTFSQITQSALQVHAGAEEMALGAQNLAQNSAEQAGTVESLNSSLQNVSEHVRNNAEHADTMEKLSGATIEFVEEGNQQMQQMLQSMQDINHASNEILNIVKVIDDIASQTNILALNASVEAARAGAAGKGFAVVADEVRSLASKSAAATETTTALIQKTIDSVKKGLVIADQTAQSLNQIVEKTTQVNALINQIAEASNEQARAITDLDSGMAQISAVTQTNSATAEESAAASEELNEQSEMLKELIEKFRTKE